MRHLMTMCVAALVLAGCATPEQQAAEKRAEVTRMMQIYGPACDRLGYAANSDQWRSCVLQLATRDDIDRYGHPHFYGSYGRSRWAMGGAWGPYW
jgi:hypothetical protein